MDPSLAGHAISSARRAVDIFAALLGLIILAPVMLLIAILIRIGTPGPVFYAQQRLGQGGRLFWIYKYRKFWHRDLKPGYSVTLKKDPRMTRIGRILEHTKLDELPQLWNILRGDMSIVGPRPETLEFADCFTDRYRAVLSHRPGLFGPSQTIFRHESAMYPDDRDPHEFYRTVLFPAKVNIDLTYYQRRTPVSDVLWTIRGVGATLGISSSQNVVERDRIRENVTWSRGPLDGLSTRPNLAKREPLT